MFEISDVGKGTIKDKFIGFLAHLSQRLIGELTGYPSFGVRGRRRRRRGRRQQFQTSSSRKPLDQSKPNFM